MNFVMASGPTAKTRIEAAAIFAAARAQRAADLADIDFSMEAMYPSPTNQCADCGMDGAMCCCPPPAPVEVTDFVFFGGSPWNCFSVRSGETYRLTDETCSCPAYQYGHWKGGTNEQH